MGVETTIRERLGFSGPVYFSEHHLSHASSTFFLSPFEEAAILTVDGVGEWATCAQLVGRGATVAKRREIRYPHSLGLLYSTLTAFLGFKVNDAEYKIMGLASYGKPRFRAEFDQLMKLHADGSFTLSLPYFSYMYDGEKMYSTELESLLGPPRHSHEPIDERHRDLAASLQAVTEDAMVALAGSCRHETANLCLAGGVAYNCVANSQVVARSGFKRVFIQPAAGDSGAALGAALWASHEVMNVPRRPSEHNTMLGPAFSEKEILEGLERFDVRFVRLEEAELCRRVAALIHKDLIVGWFQGRMEFGPRALGGRSILANPCSPGMKDILNARVKFREEFRPFAPAVAAEAASTYFKLDGPSPFMLLAPRVCPERAAEIPSVTHVDGTARVQTVSATQQPLFHRLIRSFAELSGVPVLINTSFNIQGEPIVCTPEDAIQCFLGTDIDFLAIGPFLVSKV
jgi:carbamoyltransferase